MRLFLTAVVFALGVSLTGCSNTKVAKVISGKITETHGKYSRANDFKILVDTVGGVIHTLSDNTFWDFEAKAGDSVLVTIYTDGSAFSHTYQMRSDMVKGVDDDHLKDLKDKGLAY